MAAPEKPESQTYHDTTPNSFEVIPIRQKTRYLSHSAMKHQRLGLAAPPRRFVVATSPLGQFLLHCIRDCHERPGCSPRIVFGVLMHLALMFPFEQRQNVGPQWL
jgi:hypothetical protein